MYVDFSVRATKDLGILCSSILMGFWHLDYLDSFSMSAIKHTILICSIHVLFFAEMQQELFLVIKNSYQ